jgi:hypothetical protein
LLPKGLPVKTERPDPEASELFGHSATMFHNNPVLATQKAKAQHLRNPKFYIGV